MPAFRLRYATARQVAGMTAIIIESSISKITVTPA